MGFSDKYFELCQAEERIARANRYLRNRAILGTVVLTGMCALIWVSYFWGMQ